MTVVFISDSFTSSHPVSVPINDPSEVLQLYIEIAYRKGASVVRMLANILGMDVFNRGIQHYLTKHQYGNAKQVKHSAIQVSLWGSLTKSFFYRTDLIFIT